MNIFIVVVIVGVIRPIILGIDREKEKGKSSTQTILKVYMKYFENLMKRS